jgi:hypothetical protein
MDLKTDITLRSIKIVDIGYITALYFLAAYYLGAFLDNFFIWLYGMNFKIKTNNQLLFEILMQVMFTGILSYIGRNIIQKIPFPLNGVKGFVHTKVKELTSGAILTFFLILFQYNLYVKISYVRNRKISSLKIEHGLAPLPQCSTLCTTST